MGDINWTKAIVSGIICAIAYPFVNRLFVKGEYESDLTTETGEYHVHIERMRHIASPYLQVKIEDKTRNRKYSKRFKDKDLIQSYDADKKDEVVRELVLWYENHILTKLTGSPETS